ncbi:GspE/PulE family protein [Patescibacteria group bacterium]
MFKKKQKIEEYLLEQNLISKEIYEQFKSDSSSGNIFDFLLANRILDEDKVTQIKSKYFKLPVVDLMGLNLEPKVLRLIPQEVAENYHIICFNKKDDEIHVGLVSPDNFKAIDAINFLAQENNFKIKYFLISETSFESAFRRYKTLIKEVDKLLDIAEEERLAEELKKQKGKDESLEIGVEEVIKGAPVSKMVSVILRHAVEGDASDIHIEPSNEQTKVRYRIDGMLHVSLILPSYIHPSVVARIKILSNLKIDETRIPQDGRMRLMVDNKIIDFRVSTMPLMGKEKIVMRILDTGDKALSLKELGFSDRQNEIIKKNIHKPNGIVLVTGPTGSGKSTTLYSILDILNKETVNIITLEDPVEYTMHGINQSQVNTEIDYTFATGLRAILRQDPDIIMVGEIRDSETAELAIHAALTGHSVLSTLHTNDAIGSIPRLIDMKVEPFLLSSTINAIVAQRLVRKICAHCKEEISIADNLELEVREIIKDVPSSDIPDNIIIRDGEKLKFFKGKGCNKCGNTGYKGRTVIAEVLDISDDMRILISTGFEDIIVVDDLIKKEKMLKMLPNAYIKALSGETSMDEVLRVTKE